MNDADFSRPAGRTNLVEKLNVGRVVLGPFFRSVVLVIDSLDRAHRLARTAIDAFVGVDVEHPVSLIDAVHWALINTRAVFHIHTGERDYVSQSLWFLSPAILSPAAEPGHNHEGYLPLKIGARGGTFCLQQALMFSLSLSSPRIKVART